MSIKRTYTKAAAQLESERFHPPGRCWMIQRPKPVHTAWWPTLNSLHGAKCLSGHVRLILHRT